MSPRSLCVALLLALALPSVSARAAEPVVFDAIAAPAPMLVGGVEAPTKAVHARFRAGLGLTLVGSQFAAFMGGVLVYGLVGNPILAVEGGISVGIGGLLALPGAILMSVDRGEIQARSRHRIWALRSVTTPTAVLGILDISMGSVLALSAIPVTLGSDPFNLGPALGSLGLGLIAAAVPLLTVSIVTRVMADDLPRLRSRTADTSFLPRNRARLQWGFRWL